MVAGIMKTLLISDDLTSDPIYNVIAYLIATQMPANYY